MPGDRQPQQRAVETRAALLDAALDCLVERGYAATTTPEIARRAGVSRGAQLHHFPTKAGLLAAAVDRLLERRLEEFRKAFADLPPGADRVGAAIEVLWSMFEGPVFPAWAELWMAARTDPGLAAVVVALDGRFQREAADIYLELFPPGPGDDPAGATFPLDLAFTLMDGMAFQRLVGAAPPRPAAELLAVLKTLADTFGPTQPDPEPPARYPR
jgi:AcrR family transcriptional regulator